VNLNAVNLKAVNLKAVNLKAVNLKAVNLKAAPHRRNAESGPIGRTRQSPPTKDHPQPEEKP